MLVAVSRYGPTPSTSCHTWPCPHAFTQSPGTLSAVLWAQRSLHHNADVPAFFLKCAWMARWEVSSAEYWSPTRSHTTPCRKSSSTYLWKVRDWDQFRGTSPTGEATTTWSLWIYLALCFSFLLHLFWEAAISISLRIKCDLWKKLLFIVMSCVSVKIKH